MDLSLKKFWSFKEDSAWEGIVWRSFFSVENNQDAIEVLKNELLGIDDDIIKETYSIEEDICEYEVDILTKYSNHDVYRFGSRKPLLARGDESTHFP